MDISNIEKKYKNSRFSKLFENNNVYCICHSLTTNMLYGDVIMKRIYDSFNDYKTINMVFESLENEFHLETLKQIIPQMIHKGLLIDIDEADVKSYIKKFNIGISQYKIQNMYFLITSNCNLRCKYCFVEDDNRNLKFENMTLETAQKGIDVFAKLTQEAEPITITFYGGEPLMNKEVLYATMKYIRKLEKDKVFSSPVQMTLITNGLLIDDETIKVLKETDCNVSVSIDGPQIYHDACRIDIAGKGSFERVLNSFNKLKSAGLDVGVSCTLNKFNIEHIEEITDFIIEKLAPRGMGFNILLPTINACNPVEIPDHAFASRQLIIAFEKLRRHGIYEDRVMRRVRPFSEKGFHVKDCMGVGGQIVISPSGLIGPCQAFLGVDEFFPYSVDQMHLKLEELNSDYLYNESKLFNEWRQRFPLNMKDCIDCYAISICGGGCPYAAYVNHSSIWKIDDRICYQAKQIFDWMIWDAYQNQLRLNKES